MQARRESNLIPRRAQAIVRRALLESRVVLVNGPRQSGKTTLVRAEAANAEYRTLDDAETLSAALRDPAGFIDVSSLLVIDEFQRAGDPLLLAVKASVDRDPRPGRFLLTGSTRFLTVPNISESLAGRVQIVDLWPLSQGEVRRQPEAFIDRLLDEPESLRRADPAFDRADLFRSICVGGFPAIVTAGDRERQRWHRDYVRTVVQRDIRDLTAIRRSDELPRLLRFLAVRTAQEMNTSRISQDLGLRWNTVSEYLALLESAYLSFRVPAWSRNLTTKAIRHPKVHIVDTGLAANLLRVDMGALLKGHAATGQLVETFVTSELARQLAYSDVSAELGHFRDRGGAEVALVIEAWDGRVAGIEAKSGASVRADDFRSLELVRDRVGPDFVQGVVLYAGRNALPFGDRLLALPISALWAGP